MERILHRGIARSEDDGTIILRDQIRLRIINSSECFDGYCDACKSDGRTDKSRRTHTHENSRVKFIVTRITIKSSPGREIARGLGGIAVRAKAPSLIRIQSGARRFIES